jgi:hypothetical protein
MWSLVAQSPKGLLWINEKSFKKNVDSLSWNATLEASGQVPGLSLMLYLQCSKLAFNIKVGRSWGDWVPIPNNSYVSKFASKKCNSSK